MIFSASASAVHHTIKSSTTGLDKVPAVGETVTLTECGPSSPTRLCTVVDCREIPAVPGPGGRLGTIAVRLPNNFWYDLATGLPMAGRLQETATTITAH